MSSAGNHILYSRKTVWGTSTWCVGYEVRADLPQDRWEVRTLLLQTQVSGPSCHSGYTWIPPNLDAGHTYGVGCMEVDTYCTMWTKGKPPPLKFCSVKLKTYIGEDGDYKLTVNQVAKTDAHPLPRIEDICPIVQTEVIHKAGPGLCIPAGPSGWRVQEDYYQYVKGIAAIQLLFSLWASVSYHYFPTNHEDCAPRNPQHTV